MRHALSHPPALPAVGFLDPAPTLRVTAAAVFPSQRPPLPLLLLADRLAALYAMVFPDRPDWPAAEVVDWHDEMGAATAVERFLDRVNALFPVYADIWEADLDVLEWRLQDIPVVPLGYDLWYDEWSDLKEPAPYLLHMTYSRGEAPARDADDFAARYPAHAVPDDLDPRQLVPALRRLALPAPLDALPDLLLMLDHATGNVWLDVGEMSLADGGGYPTWSREDVGWLAAEWQAASPVADRVHALLDWHETNAAAKLTAVRDALLDAHRLPPGDTAVAPDGEMP